MVENWDVKEKLTTLTGNVKTNIQLLDYIIVDLKSDMFDMMGKIISDGCGEVRINIPTEQTLVILRKEIL